MRGAIAWNEVFPSGARVAEVVAPTHEVFMSTALPLPSIQAPQKPRARAKKKTGYVPPIQQSASPHWLLLMPATLVLCVVINAFLTP